MRVSTLLVAFLAITVSAARADLNDGLIAFYPFAGNANDASGNGNHATPHGAGLTTDRFGTPNSAYGFDGIDDYIEVNNSAVGNFPGAGTVAFWFFPYSWEAGDRIVEKDFQSWWWFHTDTAGADHSLYLAVNDFGIGGYGGAVYIPVAPSIADRCVFRPS